VPVLIDPAGPIRGKKRTFSDAGRFPLKNKRFTRRSGRDGRIPAGETMEDVHEYGHRPKWQKDSPNAVSQPVFVKMTSHRQSRLGYPDRRF
jgi:hypothetical protein